MNKKHFLFATFLVLSACATNTPGTPDGISQIGVNDDLAAQGVAGPIRIYTDPRDLWLEPFSNASIWNVPLGAKAQYITKGHGLNGVLPIEESVNADEELHYKEDIAAPERPIYAPGSWNKRCDGTKLQLPNFAPKLRVSNDFYVADAVGEPGQPGYSTPNNVATFLRPDGKTLLQLEPLARCTPSGPVYGYYNDRKPFERIDALGTNGTHFGSGLSGFGGSIRYGELSGNAPIRHALKLNVFGRKYLAYNNDGTKGYRWPADRADSYAGNPDGYCTLEPCKTNPLSALEMGALLAIPPSVNADSLGLKTAAAKKMFQALQNYGTYIVDDTYYTTYAWSVTAEALGEFEEISGYGFAQSKWSGGASKDWYDDQMKLITALAVVNDNAQNRVGGAGGAVRRAPFASPFYKKMDSSAPSTPNDLKVSELKPKSALLSWNASSDNVRVMKYQVFRNGQVVAQTFGHTSVRVKALTPETAYNFTVRSVDTGLNNSSQSTALAVTTPAVPPNSYSNDFDDNKPDDWTLENASVAGGKLQIGNNFQAVSSAILKAPEFVANYTIKASLQAIGGAEGNKSLFFFNRKDANNTYVLELNGIGGVSLQKRIGGNTTAVASSTVTGVNAVEISYEAGGYLTVKLNGNTVFDRVRDQNLRQGSIGFGGQFNNLSIDDLEISGVVTSNPATGPFAQNFDDGTAPDWLLSPADQSGVDQYGRLSIGNYGAFASGLHPGLESGSFTYSFDLLTYASDVQYNKLYTYFNAQDTNNTYALEVTGGTANRVRLLKIAEGVESELAVYAGNYSVYNTGARFKIAYDSNARAITVQAERDGLITTLFNAVTDSNFSSGHIGHGISYAQALIDNAKLQEGALITMPGGFSSNFDDGTAPGWTLDAVTLIYGRMDVGNYGANGSAVHAGVLNGSYRFGFDMFTYASDTANNKNFAYFNFRDSQNTYALEITGGTANSVKLLKAVNGAVTTLGTYTGNYSILNDSGRARFTVTYNATTQSITIVATRGGTTTTLFENIVDSSFVAGQVGFGVLYSQVNVDSVTLEGF